MRQVGLQHGSCGNAHVGLTLHPPIPMLLVPPGVEPLASPRVAVDDDPHAAVAPAPAPAPVDADPPRALPGQGPLRPSGRIPGVARGHDSLVVEALGLRRWALSVLARPAEEVTAADWHRAPRASPHAWRLFLSSERCCLPLVARLPQGHVALPPGPLAVLQRGAEVEGARVLGVRGQLRRLGALAERHGWPMVVLKSGAALLHGSDPVDLSDLDVLVPESCAAAVERTLVGAGYESCGAPTTQHLAGLLWGGTAKVEVHVSLRALHAPSALAGSVAAPGDGRLRVLARVDHAWHLLHHPVQAHPERRGQLRDLLLLGGALTALDGAEAAALEQRAREAGSLAPVYLRMLRQARRLRAGGAEPDEFRREAACRLMLHDAPTVRARAELLLTWPARPLYGLASGVPVVRTEWREAVTLGGASQHRTPARIEAALPPAGRALRRAYRLAVAAAALVQARWLAGRAARLVRLAG